MFDSDPEDDDIHRWGNYQHNKNITDSAVCLIQIVDTVIYIDGEIISIIRTSPSCCVFDSNRGDGDILRWGHVGIVTDSVVCLIQVLKTVIYTDW